MYRAPIEEVTWHEDALTYAAYWGLTLEEAESVVRHPAQTAVDPRSAEVDYQILRHRTGDIVVVAGYLIPTSPKILFVTTLTGLERARSSGKGSGSGSTLPRSWRELRRRIVNLGYTITLDDHPKVQNKDGETIYVLPGTSSDVRALGNNWRGFSRAHGKEMAKQRLQNN